MPYFPVWLIREPAYGHNTIEVYRAYSVSVYRVVFLWNIFINLWLRNRRSEYDRYRQIYMFID